MTQYLALLRGINVGGKNIIKMSDLKECFKDLGFADIFTYIQSGNIIFRTNENNKILLIDQIEKALTTRFNYDSKIVLLTHQQVRTIVKTAPPEFGKLPAMFKYDVIFLRNGLSPNDIINRIKIKENVDAVFVGNVTIYFSRLISRLTQSKLKNVITLPEYQNMTIRNWNTTKEILYLMDQNNSTKA